MCGFVASDAAVNVITGTCLRVPALKHIVKKEFVLCSFGGESLAACPKSPERGRGL